MRKCWEEDPQERPQFAELVKILEEMLGLELDYLDLDCLTGVSNKEYFLEDQDPQGDGAAGVLSKPQQQLRWDEEEDEEEIPMMDDDDHQQAQQQHGYLNMMDDPGRPSSESGEKVPLVTSQDPAPSEEPSSTGYLVPIVSSNRT